MGILVFGGAGAAKNFPKAMKNSNLGAPCASILGALCACFGTVIRRWLS